MYEPAERRALATELASAFLEGRWRSELLAERGAGVLDRWPAWMAALAFATAGRFRIAPDDDRAALVAFIDAFLTTHPAEPGGLPAPQVIRALRATPFAEVRRWPVAHLDSFGALADRLELSTGQLQWLADARGLERTVPDERLRNYRYRWVPRRSGLPRLVEAPKGRLKEIQRWILREILDHVPTHDAAHGFVRRRSVASHAAVHVGRPIVLRCDLRDFFAAVPAGRVYAVFRSVGYGRAVAHTLTGLCTNTIPPHVWAAAGPAAEPRLVAPRFWLGRQLATPHLPQGAPTSAALANLVAYRLDARLSGLAAAFGLRYSRYADDLTFSGRRLGTAENRTLLVAIATVAAEEGFRIHDAKTMLRTAAQRQLVTGIVVNERLNVPRETYDRLRATLHRLRLDGPGAIDQRRLERSVAVDLEAHLRGQVAWISSLHPGRGAKLERLLNGIDWS